MKTLTMCLSLALLCACAPDKKVNREEYPDQPETSAAMENPVAAVTDPNKGIGAVKNVTLNTPLAGPRKAWTGYLRNEVFCLPQID
jgi:hypothetical protein